jgi:hypothetical protein
MALQFDTLAIMIIIFMVACQGQTSNFGWGDEVDEEDKEVIFTNAQCPMPNAQSHQHQGYFFGKIS